MTAKKKVLFATDYSQSTDHALTYASSLARNQGATLLVAHVSELEQYPVGELFDEEPRPSDSELARLRAVAPPDPGIQCEHRLLHGDPAEEIVKLADQEAVESIVIGMHGHSRLLRLLGGSVGEKILRTAHCPVIAYRSPPGNDAPEAGNEMGGLEPRGKAQARDADLQRTVNEWAAHRPQLFRVFNAHGIDVVCDGHKRLAEVCREKDLNPRHLADELAAAARPAYRESGTDWHQASVTELCNHIEATHHEYLRRELPRLARLVAEIAQADVHEHAELEAVREVFERFRHELMDHVETERDVLFPALCRRDAGETPEDESLAEPGDLIQRMKQDHGFIGEMLLQLRRLTNGYSAPVAAPATYRTMLAALWELEANLQLNLHEEDEILFPKALAR